MRFHLENELEQFDFKDAQLMEWKMGENMLLEIAAPIAKPSNPQNESMDTRYIECMELHLFNANITGVVKEGYKYYDANDVLQNEVPDEPIAELEWDAVIKNCVQNEAYFFQMVPTATKAAFCYEIFLDVGNDTYIVTVSFDKSIEEWERFQNKVMY